MRSFVAILALLALGGGVSAIENKVVGRDGKTIGVILDCNSCKDPAKGKDCRTGVQDGYFQGKPCGQCLLVSNYGIKLMYPYDLYVTGTMNQPDGSPLANEFVRLYLPNTWTVRTRTNEKGFFRLILGATEAREGESMSFEIGSRQRTKARNQPDYALYMLPENYKPCTED